MEPAWSKRRLPFLKRMPQTAGFKLLLTSGDGGMPGLKCHLGALEIWILDFWGTRNTVGCHYSLVPISGLTDPNQVFPRDNQYRTSRLSCSRSAMVPVVIVVPIVDQQLLLLRWILDWLLRCGVKKRCKYLFFFLLVLQTKWTFLQEFLKFLVVHHRFISFALYILGFVWFVLSLVKRYYMRQFSLVRNPVLKYPSSGLARVWSLSVRMDSRDSTSYRHAILLNNTEYFRRTDMVSCSQIGADREIQSFFACFSGFWSQYPWLFATTLWRIFSGSSLDVRPWSNYRPRKRGKDSSAGRYLLSSSASP